MKKFVIVLSLLFFGFSQAQEPIDVFAKANEAYKKGDYQKAIGLYEKAMQKDEVSGELYYNLGNAYYKINQIAPSIYYYEKAMQLLPNDEDLRYNLSLVDQMKMDKIDKVPENILLRYKKKMNVLFSYNTWAILAVFWAFFGLLTFGIFLFSHKINLKRISFVWMFLSLFFLLFSWYNADFGKKLSNQKYGIIFSPHVNLLTEPNLTSDKVFDLHEGTKLKVLRKSGEWELVKLPDGKKGWLPAADIRLLD